MVWSLSGIWTDMCEHGSAQAHDIHMNLLNDPFLGEAAGS